MLLFLVKRVSWKTFILSFLLSLICVFYCSGCFIAASEYEDQLALFSVSMSDNDIIDKVQTTTPLCTLKRWHVGVCLKYAYISKI